MDEADKRDEKIVKPSAGETLKFGAALRIMPATNEYASRLFGITSLCQSTNTTTSMLNRKNVKASESEVNPLSPKPNTTMKPASASTTGY